MPTVSVNLDTMQYIKINSGLNPLLLQAHRDSVRVVLSSVKPAKTNPTFHLIGGDSEPLKFDSIDTDVWALAVSDRSSLIVSETDDIKVVTKSGDQVVDLLIKTNNNIASRLADVIIELKKINVYNAMSHDEELSNEDT